MDEKQLYLFENINNRNLQRRYIITLPLDTIILISIVFVLLLILSYSLGIEKGKKNIYSTAKETYIAYDFLADKQINATDNLVNSNKEVEDAQQVQKQVPKNNVEQKPDKKINTQENENTIVEEKITPKEIVDKKNQVKKYVIQVASYKAESVAQNEVKKLKQQGYPAFISKKGDFIVVFVGEFSDKDKAKKYQQALQKIYNDCLLRTL